MICNAQGAAAGRPRWPVLFLALTGGACGFLEQTTDEEDVSTPRCEDCVGEDGGDEAPPAEDGQTVAVLQTQAPDLGIDEFILRGTIPVPPHTYPRPDGKDPFVVLDWDGAPLTTQTEIVALHADGADGADVVEVLAKVHRDPAASPGDPVRYAVVQAPRNALPSAGTSGLEDLASTEDVPAELQALLADPDGIEITTYDCFGNKYVCRPLDGTGTYELMRRGRVVTELRIYQTMEVEPFVPGPTGTLPHYFGVHTYLSTMTGQEILGFDLRFNNGSTGRDTSTNHDDPLDKVYFREIEVTLPAPLVLLQDFDDPYFGDWTISGDRRTWDLVQPMAGGKLHVMRWQGQFHRRLWICGADAFATARSYGNGIGQGYSVRGTDPLSGQAYWSWWNKGTAHYFPQKYQLPALDHVGTGALRAQLFDAQAHLARRLFDGSSDGDYPIASGVLGWGHPYGVSYGGMTSGEEIFCWDGVTLAASASTWGLRLYRGLHRMHTDRHPAAFYDLDGEPTSVERWLVENGNRDYVPFYHYLVPFLGGSYPDPFGFAAAPRFHINYVQANGLQPPYEGAHFSYDPHDYQHFIRYTRSAKVLAWLGNDSLAKDDLRMQAENFHLSYHAYYNDPYGGVHSSGLRAQQALVAAHPGKGGPFGRGEAWGLDCAIAAFCTGDIEWRQRKRPWMEDIVELLLEQQGACNGFLQALVSSKAVGGKYRARQQIEQSITENMLQGLRESVFRGIDPGHADMARDVLVESLYGFIGGMAFEPSNGPWRYTGIGPLDIERPIWCSRSQMPGDAVTPGDFETYQDWSSFAYAFEITGDPIFLERALVQCWSATDLYSFLRNQGTDNIENRSALLALLQHERGEL